MKPLPETISDLLFPPLCVHCGREGVWLCQDGMKLVQKIPFLVDPLQIKGVARVWCAGPYDDEVVRDLVQGIKYHGWTAYAAMIRVLFSQFPPIEGFREAALIPVPLPRARQLERGFNQAEMISDELMRLGLGRTQKILKRIRLTRPQAQLKATQRETNLRGAFRLSDSVESAPEYGILVDDVITTGSTIRECASVLRKAGMKKIVAVALAKG